MWRLAASIFFVITIVISSTQERCFKIHESGVNPKDQKNILDKHNSLRLSLAKGNVNGQPRACNMKRLEYDPKLAEKAQKIANTCKFKHVRVRDPRWSWIGQNLFISSGSEASWNSAIQNWFNEHKLYHYPDDYNSKTGHYTQLAWAKTEYVGCGFTSYELSKGKHRKLYVCNYGPGGNVRGIHGPYKTFKTGQCGCRNLC